MDSCFPPLAGLSLRGSSKNAGKSNKNRHSTDGSHHNSTLFYRPNDYSIRNQTEIMPKLEVLQDLDLYYIRQIAQSFKVSVHFFWMCLSFFFEYFNFAALAI